MSNFEDIYKHCEKEYRTGINQKDLSDFEKGYQECLKDVSMIIFENQGLPREDIFMHICNFINDNDEEW